MASKPKSVWWFGGPLAVILGMGGYLGAMEWVDQHRPPVVVAVIDTGIDLKRAPELQDLLDTEAKGWNFFDNNEDLADLTGHGTAVAQVVAKGCDHRCRILPLRIARHGGGIRPDDLAKAVDYAVAHGARVINCSFGITEGSDALKASLSRATDAGAVVVAAAGEGVPNPFRPSSLSRVYPQSYEPVIVVGAAVNPDEPDSMANFGEQLDLTVAQPRGSERFGSSFAAAEVSGVISLHPLVRSGKIHDQSLLWKIRHLLRATAGRSNRLDPEHMGFGLLDTVHFLQADASLGVTDQLFVSKGAVELLFSADRPVESLGGVWICPGRKSSPDISLTPNRLPKGRARLKMEAADAPECSVAVRVVFTGGSSQDLSVKAR